MIKKEYNHEYYRDIIQQTLDKMYAKYSKFISYIKENIEPKTIVDLGCGVGTLCGFLKKKYPDAEIIGIDAFDIPLNEAKRRYKDIKFLKLNLEKDKFPFKDNSIDLIVSHEVIEHLHDIGNYIKESYRILKKGGIFLLKTPNRLDIMRIISPILGKTWYADLDKTHIRYYDIFNSKKIFKKYGFSHVKTFTGTKPFFKKGLIVIPALPVVGNGLVIVAKKIEKEVIKVGKIII